MYSASDWKKGRSVARLLCGAGTELASVREVAKVDKKKGIVFLDADDTAPDSPSAYRVADGTAVANWTMGFSSRIVPIEE